MNRSKAKLSGVLHKGFKPDKWSVCPPACLPAQDHLVLANSPRAFVCAAEARACKG